LTVWTATAIIYFSYVFFYSIIYSGVLIRIKNNTIDKTVNHVLIGSTLIYACLLFDTVDVIFFHNYYRLVFYSAFAVYIGVALSLSQRFSGMYRQLEQSNVMLELQVHERTLELEEQTKIAVQASMAKSRFLANMSHEIRTPLNAVIGLSEIELQASNAEKIPASTRDNIAKIRRSGSSLLGIINDILDISKIEADRFELVPVAYDTAEMLSDTVNLNRVRIGDKPLIFKLEINGDFPARLIGDESRIRQILNNLLSNAIKYTQEGTVTLSVLCETIPGGTMARVRFIVRDTGIGIRAEDMDKLFTSYMQLDAGANRKTEGTGLGLVITKGLVEMMEGSIDVESEYGKGSVFTAEIIQDVEEKNLTRSFTENKDDFNVTCIGEETAEALRNFSYAPERKTEQTARLSLSDKKVLVVDDIRDNIQVAIGLLAPYGLQIDSATSGREAVEKAKTSHYDLIFMDHMMPEMDGIETAMTINNEQRAKSNEQIATSKKKTPIIAMTANALRGMKEWYVERGFDGYISKPIDREELDSIINKFLKGAGSGEISNEKRKEKKIEEDENGNYSVMSIEIESRRLDKLLHFNASFQTGLDIDPDYYKKFTALIESFETLPNELQEDKTLLTEAAHREDARTIREILPAFCESFSVIHNNKMNNAGTEEERELFFKRYHDSFMGD